MRQHEEVVSEKGVCDLKLYVHGPLSSLFLAPYIFAERERKPANSSWHLVRKQEPKSQDTKITHMNIKSTEQLEWN